MPIPDDVLSDEYPHWDDPRLHEGMPGLRMDCKLPSYITNPPDLSKPLRNIRIMANNILPKNLKDLETAGRNALHGAEELEDTIPLKSNRAEDIEPDVVAFTDACDGYDETEGNESTAYDYLRNQRGSARAWLMMGRDWLTRTLGPNPSAAWREPGWSDTSLAVPNNENSLLTLLRKQKEYLTGHPDLQITDPKVNYTAARAQQLYDALDKAVQGDPEANPPILGIKPAEEARKAALQTRDLCEAALRRRLRGLLGELAQKLDPLSPHWVRFGFRQPGAPDVPAKVKTLTGTPLGSGRTKLEWPSAARSTRFQVWGLAGEEEEMTLRARTQGELTILMENLPVAVPHKFKVRGVNDTGEGPFSPTVTVIPT